MLNSIVSGPVIVFAREYRNNECGSSEPGNLVGLRLMRNCGIAFSVTCTDSIAGS